MDCINLNRRFGGRYRVRYEESYFGEYGEHARVEDPAYMIIPCRYGHLYPGGGGLLAASVDGFPKIAGRLRRMKCRQIHQDGDSGAARKIQHLFRQAVCRSRAHLPRTGKCG